MSLASSAATGRRLLVVLPFLFAFTTRRALRATLFPYTTLFRSVPSVQSVRRRVRSWSALLTGSGGGAWHQPHRQRALDRGAVGRRVLETAQDRKSVV